MTIHINENALAMENTSTKQLQREKLQDVCCGQRCNCFRVGHHLRSSKKKEIYTELKKTKFEDRLWPSRGYQENFTPANIESLYTMTSERIDIVVQLFYRRLK